MLRVLLLLAALPGLPSLTFAQEMPAKPDIQGHRGARGLMPENTIPAFLEGLRWHVTTLELDVVISADSQVVVSHEPWMAAKLCLTPDGGEISPEEEKRHNIYQLPYDSIRKYDCGSVYLENFPFQEKITLSKPLLGDVLEETAAYQTSRSGRPVNYNIELKSLPQGDNIFHPEPPRFSQLVHGVIDQSPIPWERIIIQSFDERILRYWHQHYPEVTLALLIEEEKDPERAIASLGFQPEIYSPWYRLLDEEIVATLQQKGLKVIPWTVNEPGDMEMLLRWGVDGIITDYPDRVPEAWR